MEVNIRRTSKSVLARPFVLGRDDPLISKLNLRQKLEATVAKDGTKVRNLTRTKTVGVEVDGQVKSL